jgi:SAM-dependent methyltransferase
MTTSQETFQIPLAAAEIYEEKFVPAIFAEWAPHLLDTADVAPGDAVLDVACGTGIAARYTADRLGAAGRVEGVDLNEAMVTVARRVAPDIPWHQGDAADLPFPDESFDVVLCQMGLMFMPDKQTALREMARVAVSDGTVALVVPAELAAQPAYEPFVEIAVGHAGPDAASLLGTYWCCGNVDHLAELIESAGLTVLSQRTRTGTARFESVDDLVATEINGSPLRERISGGVYSAIERDSRQALGHYVTDRGAEIPLVGHIVAARPA